MPPPDAVAPPVEALGPLIPKPLHVTSFHAPRPIRRVVPGAAPPRIVTYAGTEFEVVFDGVDTRHVEEVAR